MRLFIAEKPSVATEIANCLGLPAKKTGYYEVEGNIITWLYGHVLRMFQPEEYSKDYTYWKMNDLPIIPQQWQNAISERTAKQFYIVKQLVAQADEIIHAGDPDREGQLLVDEVLTYINNRKPVKRLLLNALDKKSILNALDNIQDNANFEGLRLSAQLRQQIDWLTGINYSRAFTLAARKRGHRYVLPIGRVKTPTLAIVVRREEAIQNFKPITYFTIHALFKTNRENALKDESFQVQWQSSHNEKNIVNNHNILDPLLMRDILTRLNDIDPAKRYGQVTNYLTSAPKVEKQRRPFSLSTLQIAAGKVYGYEPQFVLDICQSLYEKKLTTYPRSDCEYLPKNQLATAAQILHNLKLTGNSFLAQFANIADANIVSPAWNDDKITAHHAIIPTESICNFDTLSTDEQNIYFLIGRAYITQFMPEHRYSQTSIEISYCDELFTASSKTVLSDLDWKTLYKNDVAADQDSNNDKKLLPYMTIGEDVALMRAYSEEKTTTPPRRFTPATLIQAMKEIHKFVSDNSLQEQLKTVTGIGTEATRATIIDDLIKNEFLIKDKKNIRPSEKATHLISLLPDELTFPDFTALMEIDLAAIVAGTTAASDILNKQINQTKNLCERVQKNAFDIPAAPNTIACSCGHGILVQRNGQNGIFWGCSNYPNCKRNFSDKNGAPVLKKTKEKSTHK